MPYDKRDIQLIKKVEEDKESMNLKEKKKYYDRMENFDIKDRVIREGNFFKLYISNGRVRCSVNKIISLIGLSAFPAMIINTMLFVEQGEQNTFLYFWVPFAFLCFTISLLSNSRLFVSNIFNEEDDAVQYLNKDLDEKKQELRKELAQDIASDLD